MEISTIGPVSYYKTMTVLLLGATSNMAVALARHYASNGHNLQLAARSSKEIEILKNDFSIRYGITAEAYPFDALDYHNHAQWYAAIPNKPDLVILVFGYLGDHERATHQWEESQKIIASNYTGAVSILNVIAHDFEQRKKGTIVGISSVAGDRGRMSNYVYGSAKAGLTAYLSGLRNRLTHAGVHVMTVKPGFVRTKMTEGLPLPAPVTATPEKVASLIYKAAQKKKNSIYVLPIWAPIMLIIKNIPEFIFKKLKL